MSQLGDIEPDALPDLNLPKGDTCVDISIINTTTEMFCPSNFFVIPVLKGHEYLNFPTYAFHIRHPSGKEIVFDLGARKDYWNISPPMFAYVKKVIPGLAVEKNVDEILTDGGVDLDNIVALIWSHWYVIRQLSMLKLIPSLILTPSVRHYDHTGDPSQFPKRADLLVGPGFKEAMMPGYPTSEAAPTLDTDFEGRNVIEVPFSDDLKIGNFQAHDYFNDGSFYILNVPGHAVGHISALARTTADTFVFLGGDVCHFGGTFRPSKYSPMPENIPDGVPLDHNRFQIPCPCSIFTACHPNKGHERTSPYYEVTQIEGSWYSDPPAAQQSVDALVEFDAHPNVMVCIAHDTALLPILDFFPNGTLNDWKQNGWKTKTQWGFLDELPINEKPAREDHLVPGLMKDGQRMKDWEEYVAPR